jgi:hypothetical protein
LNGVWHWISAMFNECSVEDSLWLLFHLNTRDDILISLLVRDSPVRCATKLVEFVFTVDVREWKMR